VNNLKILQENLNNPYNSNNRINLEPLQLNVSRNDYINRVISNNQENNHKIAEDVNRQNINKQILKPIEINDINKNQKDNNNNNDDNNKNNNKNLKNIGKEKLKTNTDNYNKNIANNMNFSQYAKINNKPIYNSNSTSNLFGQNRINQDNSIGEAKNYITGKNFLNGEFDNNFNFNMNLKSNNELLKIKKSKEAAATNDSNLNSTIFKVNNQSPVCEKKIIDKFSKTSNFEFNIIDNLNVINLNTDISLIEENLKMNKGEFIKKLKSLYDDFNNSQKMFRKNNSCINSNKSYYNNTIMGDRDKNINKTRIETIFENYEVKLEEMISLNINKSTRKLGNLKKMLHGSLDLYVVRVL